MLIIASLFIWEVTDYLSPAVKQEIIVDISRNRQMAINFDIMFPFVPCYGKTSSCISYSLKCSPLIPWIFLASNIQL